MQIIEGFMTEINLNYGGISKLLQIFELIWFWEGQEFLRSIKIFKSLMFELARFNCTYFPLHRVNKGSFQILPLPNSFAANKEGDNISENVSLLRGTQEWAPPRPQIIFTPHPPPM